MSSMSNLEKKSIEKQFVIDALAEDSWRMFKIMGEFVNGFEEMADVGKAVTIFGSARFKPDNPYYQQATDLAAQLAECGYAVITGGGPGIMEAGNKGAFEAKGQSIGLNIDLPFEQHANPYLTSEVDFKYFLYAQGDAGQILNGLCGLSGWVWYPGRAVRSPHPYSNSKDFALPRLSGRARFLARANRLAARHAFKRRHHQREKHVVV